MKRKTLKKIFISTLTIVTLAGSVVPVCAQERLVKTDKEYMNYAARTPEAGVLKSTYLYSKPNTSSKKVAAVKAGDFGVLCYATEDSYYRIVNGVKWAYIQISMSGSSHVEGWIQAKFVDDPNGVLE